MNWQHYWKSILAFLSLVTTNVAVALVQSGQPWPETGQEWGVFALTTTLGTWLVFQKGNAPKRSDA
ncbi:hypothetical protein [Mycobacterium sp. SMC-4]|uniref:hypothetical protein n=1 Tax=Mycobacterium sp. SMC-4 TaxID=2857059 RepID=UPI0021B497E9|nr:hypothetical protein [Mycobacterium sp. SMC-4]UXA19569.1 hypothetical protein KXD98_08205 [Mycobacterium sp. SMC-4]